MGILDRMKAAWNVFAENDKPQPVTSIVDMGPGYSRKPDQLRIITGNERSIISSIYTRLGMDIAAIDIRHIRVDENEQFAETMDSELQNCLQVSANLDQAARAFRQDVAMTIFDAGVAAIVPENVTANPYKTGGFDIKSLRVGTIVQWYPEHVTVRLYRQSTGQPEEVTLPKNFVGIVENPLYTVMNEPNSTLQRLIRKLSLLDAIDEQASANKLDLIIQLPYVIKSEARRQQAEKRREDIEFQLKSSKYGIAYTDGTEKITQLNRPAENNLLGQIEYLTKNLYSELGLTPEVFQGTADERTMLNYFNRTIEPVLDAIVEEMNRKFLTRTARSQKQRIEYFRNPFKLVPVDDLANIADKMTRNEILTSNEMRGLIGFRPVDDTKANELRNKNLPLPTEEVVEEERYQNES